MTIGELMNNIDEFKFLETELYKLQSDLDNTHYFQHARIKFLQSQIASNRKRFDELKNMEL